MNIYHSTVLNRIPVKTASRSFASGATVLAKSEWSLAVNGVNVKGGFRFNSSRTEIRM